MEPGAVFGPKHDHRDRRGVVHVLAGTITDHRDGVTAGYGPGLGWPEDRNTLHWLEDRGSVAAVEVSVDIIRSPDRGALDEFDHNAGDTPVDLGSSREVAGFGAVHQTGDCRLCGRTGARRASRATGRRVLRPTRSRDMDMDGLVRGSAVASVTGGLLLIAACVYRSTLPRGCIDEECLTQPQRGDTPLGTLLATAAALLLVAAGIGLIVQLLRSKRLGRLGGIGLVLAGLGVVSLVAGGVAAGIYGPDFAAMPAFVLPGVGLIALGIVVLAVALLRSRYLPAWASATLLVGGALLILVNEQTARVLFAVPFGLAWVIVGVAEWRLAQRRESLPAAGG